MMRATDVIARSVADSTIDSEPYWRGVDEGVLRLQRCAECETFIFRPRPICPECSSSALVWTPVSGEGRVWSYSVVHRPVSKAFAPFVPYVVGLIELDEGPIMMSNIVNVDLDSLTIGQRVGVVFGTTDLGRSVPLFRPLNPSQVAIEEESSRDK